GAQASKYYLLAHPEIDLLGTNGASLDWQATAGPVDLDYRPRFERWRTQGKPFDLWGLGLMFRRRALPLLGLFHTGCVWVDKEFTLRATAGAANLAFHTASTYVRVMNPQSNTVTQPTRVLSDEFRLGQFYGESQT